MIASRTKLPPDEVAESANDALLGVLAGIEYNKVLDKRYTMEDAFLVGKEGRLIMHTTRHLRADRDEDILAGMLTAVQTFVKESFDESGGRLKEIKFENYDIVISHSKSVVIAAIISTKKPEKLRSQLKLVTEDIEAKFGDKLKHWGGDKHELGDVDILMKRLLGGKYRRN